MDSNIFNSSHSSTPKAPGAKLHGNGTGRRPKGPLCDPRRFWFSSCQRPRNKEIMLQNKGWVGLIGCFWDCLMSLVGWFGDGLVWLVVLFGCCLLIRCFEIFSDWFDWCLSGWLFFGYCSSSCSWCLMVAAWLLVVGCFQTYSSNP